MTNGSIATVAARVCWLVALLYLPLLLFMWVFRPVTYGTIVWEDASLIWLALACVLPLTAPWIWFRDAVRTRYANWSMRANAYLIDLTLSYLGVFVNLIAFSIGFDRIPGNLVESGYMWNPDMLVPFVLVNILGITLTVSYASWWFILVGRGQTPGKYLLKVRVIDAETGETLQRGRMFVREFVLKLLLIGFQSGIQMYLVLWYLIDLAYFIDSPIILRPIELIFGPEIVMFLILFTPPLMFLIDILYPLYGKDGDQTLHDKLTGTHVVHIHPTT